MQDTPDLYATLQVHHLAEPEVIEAAYHRLARMYHPDLNKSVDAAIKMTLLNLAYDVLGDPDKRAEYDRQRGYRQGTTAQPLDLGIMRKVGAQRMPMRPSRMR